MSGPVVDTTAPILTSAIALCPLKIAASADAAQNLNTPFMNPRKNTAAYEVADHSYR
jgi:hypothetical protein